MENTDSSRNNPTKGDTNWRVSESGNPRKATKGDSNWRCDFSVLKVNATKGDSNWRKKMDEMIGPKAVLSGATVNVFANLEDLKKAICNLKSLESMEHRTFTVKAPISTDGGEAVVLLCSAPDGVDVAAKIYYEPVSASNTSIEARLRVLDYMATEEGKKYTLAVTEIGLVEIERGKYYFEIMPYCSERDLSFAGDLTFDEIVKITRRLNEAINSIHQAGILHRDIKPSNLFMLNGEVVLGDFGIAKLVDAGATVHTPGTEGYQAPESLMAISADDAAFYFNDKTDYYSLGVTLGTLYQGNYVYDGMNAAMMMANIQKGKLPLIKNCPNRPLLENLLNGLCRFDPSVRFGYEDVKKWLENHEYTGGIETDQWPRAWRMLNEEYNNEESMFLGISKDLVHWNEAKQMLYGKYMKEFFKSFRTDLARAAENADDAYIATDPDKGLFVFLKELYPQGPLVWKGSVFYGLKEIAEAILSGYNTSVIAPTLTNNVLEWNSLTEYVEILQKKLVSCWLSNTKGVKVDPDTYALVDKIEEYSVENPEIACFWFANIFSDEKKLKLYNSTVSTMDDFISTLFNSSNLFYQARGYEKLMDRLEGADIYGFLFSFGYQELIDQAWQHIKGSSTVNKLTYLFAMIENIAYKENVDQKHIHDFYINYGPVGIATYTKKLVCGTDKVYDALDSEGRQILDNIKKFELTRYSTIDDIFKGYSPMLEAIEKFRGVLVDNPYCVLTGIHDNKGIICCNLIGCFAFKIFECMAPIGFSSWLEKGKGEI